MERYLVTFTTPISFGRDMGYPETTSSIRTVENMFNLPPNASDISYHKIEPLTEEAVVSLKAEAKKIKEAKKKEEVDRQIAKHQAEIERLKNS